MWNVAFDYPKQELAVTFQCTFNSKHVAEVAQYLGRDMTLEVSPKFCKTYAAEWKPEYNEKLKAAGAVPCRPTSLQRKPEARRGSHQEFRWIASALENSRGATSARLRRSGGHHDVGGGLPARKEGALGSGNGDDRLVPLHDEGP